jgi:hypothetical protein
MPKHEHYESGFGPLYSIPLIDVLPINPNKAEGTLQQMPSRADLDAILPHHGRVVAGYETLLHHWRILRQELELVRIELAEAKAEAKRNRP